MAFLDTFHSTIRHSECEVLLSPGEDGIHCCSRCKAYRCNLRALVSRHQKHASDTSSTDPGSHAPFSHLSSPQKCTRYQTSMLYEYLVTILKKKLDDVIEESGLTVSTSLHDDLVQIMKDNAEVICTNHPPGTFGRVFWEAQMKAASVKDAKQMRWDPVMVRWCLYLRHLSRSAYEMLRETGTISLPSQRTLQDYTYYIKASVGFSNEVDKQLRIDGKLASCVERDKCVIIVCDEMHIRQDLTYDKHTGRLS